MKNLITHAIKAVGIYASVFILIMMLLTTVDVVLRYIFNSPLLWAYEVTEYLLVATLYLALAFTEAEGQHVNVQIVYSRLSPTGQNITYIITRAAMLAFSILLILKTGVTAYDSVLAQETGSAAETPRWPARIMVPLGFSLLSVQLVLGIVGRIRLLRCGSNVMKSHLQDSLDGKEVH
jgi:TRAP-type C4-dicarboxylate transport system permease small subunit